MEAIDAAYMAGLFDGEGSVDYTKRFDTKRKNRPRSYFCWRITCEIGMTDYHVLKWFHETLELGTFRPRKSDTKNFPKAKDQWRWRCQHRDALKFAKMIIPYAKTKKEKLRKIIKHYETSL